MKAFEVHLNGRHLLTAGVENHGVLSSIVNWTGHRGNEGGFWFEVGGIDNTHDEFVGWSVPVLSIGDEVTVKIVDTDQVTPADRRRKRER
jgi:hypothetical protein